MWIKRYGFKHWKSIFQYYEDVEDRIEKIYNIDKMYKK